MSSARQLRTVVEQIEPRILFAWGATAQLVNQDDIASKFPSITGKGISVAVIDSGINYNHPAMGGGFGAGKKVIAGYDFVDDDNDPMDTEGHGTAVAGVIAANPFTFNGADYSGVAPDANLIALRVTNGNDGAPDGRIEQALDWIIANHSTYNIRVVNISLGSGTHTASHTNATLSDEFAALASLQIAVFAASGNSASGVFGSSGIAYPAADPNVYAVGSVNANDRISSFAQRGDILDLLAPGEAVPTAKRTGGFEALEGTSFASPFIAGAAALIAQMNPGITRESIVSILRASGKSNFDGDTETGNTSQLQYPRLDLLNALKLTTARKTNKANVVGASSAASDIVYDEDGILHLAYYDATIKSIRYATRDLAGRWSRTQIVDTSGADVGIQLSIDVDTTGKPGIAYFDNTNSDLKYAHFTGGGWSVRTLDSAKSVGQSPSLAFNSQGDPVIAYYRKSGGDLRMQTSNFAGAWTRTDVDTEGDVGEWANIDVADSIGVIAIAYGDKTNGNLKYARLLDGAWTIFTVDDLAGGAAYIDLNIHNNQAFISYQDLVNGDLKFAKRENSQWLTETVYTPGNTGQFTSLVFDSSNKAHIAFYSKSKNVMYEAAGSFGNWSVKKIADGGTWLSAASSFDEDTLTFVSLDTSKKNLQFGKLL